MLSFNFKNKNKIKKIMIKCKKCGSTNVKVDYDQVYTSMPPMYGYKCNDCGEHGYVNCDEVKLSNDINAFVKEFEGFKDNSNETINTPKEENKGGGLMGWVCPKCGRCYSPFTTMCPYCNNGDWSKITCLDGTYKY